MEGLSRQPGTPARENGSRLFNGFVIYSPYDVGGRCAVPFDIGLRYGKGEDMRIKVSNYISEMLVKAGIRQAFMVTGIWTMPWAIRKGFAASMITMSRPAL